MDRRGSWTRLLRVQMTDMDSLLDDLVHRADIQIEENRNTMRSVRQMNSRRRYNALTYEVEHGVELL